MNNLFQEFHFKPNSLEKTTLKNALFNPSLPALSVLWKIERHGIEYYESDHCKGKVALIYWDLINQ